MSSRAPTTGTASPTHQKRSQAVAEAGVVQSPRSSAEFVASKTWQDVTGPPGRPAPGQTSPVTPNTYDRHAALILALGFDETSTQLLAEPPKPTLRTANRPEKTFPSAAWTSEEPAGHPAPASLFLTPGRRPPGPSGNGGKTAWRLTQRRTMQDLSPTRCAGWWMKQYPEDPRRVPVRVVSVTDPQRRQPLAASDNGTTRRSTTRTAVKCPAGLTTPQRHGKFHYTRSTGVYG